MLVSSGKIHKKYGVCRVTLRSWVEKGLIQSFATPGGHYRYLESEVRKVLGFKDEGF